MISLTDLFSGATQPKNLQKKHAAVPVRYPGLTMGWLVVFVFIHVPLDLFHVHCVYFPNIVV